MKLEELSKTLNGSLKLKKNITPHGLYKKNVSALMVKDYHDNRDV